MFVIGFQMLHGRPSEAHRPTESRNGSSREDRLGVAVSPLAMPILAGPGTIATAMNFSASGGVGGAVVTVGAFLLLCLVTYLGDNGTKVITQLMGLILAVIGTQMVIDGISGAMTAIHGAPA